MVGVYVISPPIMPGMVITEPREFTLLPLYELDEIFRDFFCASMFLGPGAAAICFSVGERDARLFGGRSSNAGVGTADVIELDGTD